MVFEGPAAEKLNIRGIKICDMFINIFLSDLFLKIRSKQERITFIHNDNDINIQKL